MYLLMSPEIVLLASKSICLPMNTLLNVFCPSLILVAYVQEAEVSARQYPRQPAVSSHIYSMHSSFSVLLSSLSSSQVMCICVYVFEWEIYCYYMCALHVFLPTSVFACFFLWVLAAVMERSLNQYIGYTIYRMCLRVRVWMHELVLVCVDLVACVHLCA